MTTSNRTSDLHPRQRVCVLDSETRYVDTGRGAPVVFLQGNPTLWPKQGSPQ
jgi:hypothetical protein